MNHEGLILFRADAETVCGECHRLIVYGSWATQYHKGVVHEGCWRYARASGRV